MAPIAAACGNDLAGPGRQLLDRDGLRAVLLPSVWPIPVGRHFNLTLAVCPSAEDGRLDGVRVDADMPKHRHGMNYRASVQSIGPGRFEVQGLMLHMPGRWRFIVDVDMTPVAGGPRTLWLTHEIDLE
ncbi:hypothetical protein [Ideonella sp. A 288]|uniref:hypothetical protein n=1 Tax=Ideonella sp. A 288 TaxID=1962181 RepID=UPI0013038A1D|nr:hypothetical protein [Ideonella sp. A 288]